MSRNATGSLIGEDGGGREGEKEGRKKGRGGRWIRSSDNKPETYRCTISSDCLVNMI